MGESSPGHPENDEVGWAILGTGVLAERFVAPAIAESRGSRITAVLSRDLSRARAFAHRHDVDHPSDDLGSILADPDVDIVYIATPNALHAEQSLRAMDAGKHVLVEKPMALTEDDGRQMIERATANERLLGVGFHLRYKPGTLAVRDAIAEGRLGRVFFAEIEVGAGKSLYPYDTWRGDPAMSGGGTVLNQGIHAVDLARFLLKEDVARVQAATSQPSLEDVFSAVCTMSDGTIVSLTSHQLFGGTRPDFIVLGEDAWVEVRGGTLPLPGEEVVLHENEDQTELTGSERTAYSYEVEAMADAVRGVGDLLGTGMDGLAGIRVAEAIYRSARTGTAVAPGSPDPS